MWPLGHVAIGYLLYSLSSRWRFDESPGSVAVVVVVFGSLFPDLVDKPLAWYLGVLPTGRSLMHSLVVLVPLCVVVYLVARRYQRGELAIAFAVGALAHPIVDAMPVLWRDVDLTFLAYPILPVSGYEGASPTMFGLLMDSLTSPWFHLEFVLGALALYLWIQDGTPGLDLVDRSRLQ